ncbi:MAG TPA: SDR family NAD(P)-dependent oxidoreductase [Gemmatimonadota bacterium]|jgi:NAD(P)-dependent dehydrogenase (short-subunit alcohol dehydrogenase family)
MPLTDRIVLVTGATGGVGPAVSRMLVSEGAHVVVVSRREDAACELARELVEAHGFGADLTDEAAVGDLLGRILSEVGRVDALVHLTGGYSGGAPVARTASADWERMLALNLRSAFLTIRAVLPGMLDRGSGSIVTVGSRAAFEEGAGMAAYAVAKSALLRLTEVLAAEVRTGGIRVNAVALSTVDTPANREAMPRAKHDAWVKPEDVGRAIVFLLGAEAVSGAVLKVYGAA